MCNSPRKDYTPYLEVLTFTPGPMVEATTQDLIYWPLAAAGFALTMASIKASRFCWSFSGPKLALPMGQWMMFGLVQAVFDLTGLGFGDSLRHVGGHGTGLGRGHQATGAQDFTQTANHAHHVGGSNDHVEVHPAFALDLLHIFVASGVSPRRQPGRRPRCCPCRKPAPGRFYRCR